VEPSACTEYWGGGSVATERKRSCLLAPVQRESERASATMELPPRHLGVSVVDGARHALAYYGGGEQQLQRRRRARVGRHQRVQELRARLQPCIPPCSICKIQFLPLSWVCFRGSKPLLVRVVCRRTHHRRNSSRGTPLSQRPPCHQGLRVMPATPGGAGSVG
jgi:hypothetical protein